jgi:hypothetical protein
LSDQRLRAREHHRGTDQHQQYRAVDVRRDDGAGQRSRRGAGAEPDCGWPIDGALAGIKPHADGAAEDEAEQAGADRLMDVDVQKGQPRNEQDSADADAPDQQAGNERKHDNSRHRLTPNRIRGLCSKCSRVCGSQRTVRVALP